MKREKEEGLTIGEAAQRAGVSVRTLHHYDRIGLLAPSRVTQAGYRLYDEAALSRLEQILFFRALDFPLEEIRRIMQSPAYDAKAAMRRQRALLMKQRERLDAMILRLERAEMGEDRARFEVFDMKEIEAMKAQYAEEARMRWGDTEAWKESSRRENARTEEAKKDVHAQMEALLDELAAMRALPPQDARVQDAVARWQAHITENYYPCTEEILCGLGQMYEADERFAQSMDVHGEGTAAFLARAIAVHCAERGA